MSNIEEQIAELSRGTDEVLPEDGLEAKLKEGRPLVVKAVMDSREQLFTANVEKFESVIEKARRTSLVPSA